MFKVYADKEYLIEVKAISFPSGERHIQISNQGETSSVNRLQKSQSVQIRANLNTSDAILDLLLLENALLNINPELIIDLLLPYLPYARQDRVCAAGQAFSMQVMSQLLKIQPKRSITVWDCHSKVGLDLTQAINIPAEQLIAHCDELVELIQSPDTALVCPDNGAVPRTQAVAQYFNQSNVVYAHKNRDPLTGQITHMELVTPFITQKTAVIIDDICDGGATFLQLSELLRGNGFEHIVLYVTHGVFSRGLQVFNGLVDAIYTTNSLPQTTHLKLTVIDVQ